MASKTEKTVSVITGTNKRKTLLVLVQSFALVITAYILSMLMFLFSARINVTVEMQLVANIVLVVISAILIASPSFWLGLRLGNRGIVYAILAGFVAPILFQVQRVAIYWRYSNKFAPYFGLENSDYLSLLLVLLYSALAGYLGSKIARRIKNP